LGGHGGRWAGSEWDEGFVARQPRSRRPFRHDVRHSPGLGVQAPHRPSTRTTRPLAALGRISNRHSTRDKQVIRRPRPLQLTSLLLRAVPHSLQLLLLLLLSTTFPLKCLFSPPSAKIFLPLPAGTLDLGRRPTVASLPLLGPIIPTCRTNVRYSTLAARCVDSKPSIPIIQQRALKMHQNARPGNIILLSPSPIQTTILKNANAISPDWPVIFSGYSL